VFKLRAGRSLRYILRYKGNTYCRLTWRIWAGFGVANGMANFSTG
jgi:hypothetical protein